ncbi:MAG: 4-hydroxythreonine-4-phosphate dehydrogenase PdxA [Pseudomonadales bacterium]|nr:4-hydroxythreonine-4-phosphate dehydrogenase PdxA [Pseudomonadales bacterium]
MSTVLAITAGEPAGIGPDLVVQLAQLERSAYIQVIADPEVLQQRASLLGLPLTLLNEREITRSAGHLSVHPISVATSVVPGELNKQNAKYVLETLNAAIQGCLDGQYSALVTGPVQKSVINDAGVPFTGHTEYLAAACKVQHVVMLLVANNLRVALATVHIPLAEVSENITSEGLTRTLHILHAAMIKQFGITSPRILVTGLNPHAGESGYLGREEIDVIHPVCEALMQQGMNVVGPLPADTLFTPAVLEQGDVVLAMYHDQGLPVLKHQGFGKAVNITLGLPIIRTSVDHGTALDLAGTGQANVGSLNAAMALAQELVIHASQSQA